MNLLLTFETLVMHLFEEFPDLAASVAARFPEFSGETPGPYIIFGTLFRDYLTSELDSGNPKNIPRVAKFLERMATSNDDRVLELLRTELFPAISEKQDYIDQIWKLVGNKARDLLGVFLAVNGKRPTV